ncbi:MAG: hypothetical protein EOM22_12480 [Gammaproteobacteria bacterium]|nr:hypothetical protein [Gammaproteobacteria bacterium]
MSVSTANIATVGDLLYWLKGVKPETPIVPARDNPAGPVLVELHWSEKPSNAHFIRIGEAHDD